MSFKPLIIDAGQFKQLPSGQALDIGGWTLPTAGGTDTYHLIADGSGNGVWTAPTFGNKIPANSAQYEVYAGTGAGTASWTTDLVGLTSLVIDNITINAFSITSDTGTVSFGDDNVFTLGTVIGNNIPSPSVDNQVLISLAADTAAWSVAGNDQFLASDSSGDISWQDIDWLPSTANTTIYVRTTGNDSTGDGSSGLPYLTVERAITHLKVINPGEYTVTVDIGEGVFSESTLNPGHPFGTNITFKGVSEQITSQDTNSISASTTVVGNQEYHEVTFILPVGKSVSVGDYITVSSPTGGTNPLGLVGVHKVSDWDSGSRTATVQVFIWPSSTLSSGTVTCTIDLIKTVLAFGSGVPAIYIEGPVHGGYWYGLTLQGYHHQSGSGGARGVRCMDGGTITLGGNSASGYALGISTFHYGLSCERQSSVLSQSVFISRVTFAASASTNSHINISNSYMSGLNIGLLAYETSTVTAADITIVHHGSNCVNARRCGYIDVRDATVILGGDTTYVLSAYDRATIYAVGSTTTGTITPTTNGNNEDSWIIT